MGRKRNRKKAVKKVVKIVKCKIRPFENLVLRVFVTTYIPEHFLKYIIYDEDDSESEQSSEYNENNSSSEN